MTIIRGGWVERVAIILAVLFLATLAILEFSVYRPQQRRLNAAQEELSSLQDQLAGLARRNLADQELYLYADTGPDGREFRRLYSSESGLVYLTRLIDGSRLDRLDFQSRNVRMDGAFRVDTYAVVVRGTYSRIISFLKTLESSPRLSRVELIKLETGGGDIVASLRVAVYGIQESR